ncbi:MAG: PAS domain-containing sensor histidine kinase, partial [Chloroflexota bacterium]
GIPKACCFRVKHADGHYISVETVGTLLYDNESKYTGGVFISRDITERKRLESSLRQNEERLRLITDNVQDLITLNDTKGKLVFVSPSARTLLGYEPESLLEMSSIDLIHPDDRQLMTQAFQTALETGTQHFIVEGRLRHADGYYIWTEFSITSILDDQSNFMGGVFVARDITERKLLEALTLKQEKLQTALDKELELGTLKTRMMQRIAHEFRTPLTVIQSSVETLTTYLDRLTPDQRADKVAKIMRYIASITDMLLQIELVINGDFKPDELNRNITDVSALCRQVAAELETQFNLPGKYILEMPQEVIFSADEQVLKNAIQPVMRNAALYSEPPSVVKVSLAYLEKGIKLCVTDTGIGILPQEQSRIFEPFFRGSNINEVGGLGVVLTIARAAIEAHEGTIIVESVLKQGTTVTLWIP